MDLNGLLDNIDLAQRFQHSKHWLESQVLVTDNLLQLVVIVLLWILSLWLSPSIRAAIEAWRLRSSPAFHSPFAAIASVAFPLSWLALQWLAVLIFNSANLANNLLTITVSLLSAWTLIKALSLQIRNPAVANLLALCAWSIAALNILNLLEPATTLLDSAAIELGDSRFSLLSVIKAVVVLSLLLWMATAASEVFEQRIRRISSITPSVQVLFTILLKIALLTVAVLAVLGSVGIDLTAFTVVGGAIGVGLGFGLQKIFANLVSGIILLLDKSIKPGDVITVGTTYGAVNSLGARYVSVLTRDGIEHLIPNEEVITQRVENWSHSNSLIRLRKLIGVHYKSDLRKAMQLCTEAANDVPRVLTDQPVVCLVRDFGDSAVNLELRFWIGDPHNGRASVISHIMLNIWDRFHQHGIEIPYPQRDVHLYSQRQGSPITEAEPPKRTDQC